MGVFEWVLDSLEGMPSKYSHVYGVDYQDMFLPPSTFQLGRNHH